MQKVFKRISLIVAMLLCTVFLGVCATACGESAANTITVSVVYPDGSAVNGETDGTGGMNENELSVQFCNADNESLCYTPISVNAEGKATVSVNDLKSAIGEAKYKVTVLGAPEGYTAEIVYLEVGKTEVTVTLVQG